MKKKTKKKKRGPKKKNVNRHFVDDPFKIERDKKVGKKNKLQNHVFY